MNKQTTNTNELTKALRDYFSASNPKDFRHAGQKLIKLCPRNMQNFLPKNIDWKEAEYAFNQLYVGPNEVIAPLCASVYLDNVPLLMSDSTRFIRDFYSKLGLQVEKLNSVPDDHLAFELDAFYFLQSQKPRFETQLAKQWLIYDHFILWIPQLINKVFSQPKLEPLNAYVLDLLSYWLTNITKEEL